MQKDNSTLRQKVALRVAALAEVSDPRVLETHAGKGVLWSRCYAHLPTGVAFEKDSGKAVKLAVQRPGWAIYQADSEKALVGGVGFHHRPNFFDLDPYGDPWPFVDVVLAGVASYRPPRVVFAVNDGLRQKLKAAGGWTVGSMAEVVRARGNDRLYAEYMDVCRDLFTQKAAAASYRLSRWTGYYCGHQGQMTHYAAVLDTRG